VLVERLRRDPDFLAALAADPVAALAGVELTADDLDRLAVMLRGPDEVPEDVRRFVELFDPSESRD
jgi:hypothetical protein